MRFVRLDPAPVLAACGVLTPRGTGARVPRDLAALSGLSPDAFRRMDRYGALAFAAAQRALAGAPEAPRRGPRGPDPDWGIVIGSSLACRASNAQHQRDLRTKPSTDWSPALFVRTVANAAAGGISIGWGLAGPTETLVSGWAAGAEAIALAGTWLEDGRARFILAGGIEAPEGNGTARDRSGLAPEEDAPTEAAALAVMGMECGPAGRPRLTAYWRGHDPDGRWSLAAALDALQPIGIGRVVLANTVRPELAARFGREAGSRTFIDFAAERGEMGAAAAPAALAEAAVGRGGTLIIARDRSGATVALAAA